MHKERLWMEAAPKAFHPAGLSLRALAELLIRRHAWALRNLLPSSCAQLHDLRRDRRDEIVDIPSPCCEGGAALLKILKSVVDRRHAADRAARVVENLVDDMRGDVQSRHTGRGGTPKIVQCPRGYLSGRRFPRREPY